MRAGKWRELDLARLPIHDVALQRIAGLRTLKVLSLSGTRMTDLRASYFFDTQQFLTELAVDETDMTADGIVRLVEHTNLKKIVLSENLFSDKDREYVKSLHGGVEVIEVAAQKAPEIKLSPIVNP
jgi:hypothetical protein